jgi:serine-type D-Ala-D-Ala carboxypeptidase (penicillin-binding protein 5/6)
MMFSLLPVTARKRRLWAVLPTMLGALLAAACLLACAPDRSGATPEAAAAATARQDAVPPSVAARSGMVMRRDTGEVLWAKDPDAQLPQASCTKIMTALLVLERFHDLRRYVKAPAGVTALQKVAIGLRPGDRITIRQALRAMLIKSANDATLTLAVATYGGEKAFVRQMNRRAASLGLKHTHFMNSRGADKTGHYSSARDLAVLGRHVWIKWAAFRSIVGTKTATITWPPSHRVAVATHNRILDFPWGDGIKTGATAKAGKVLVGSGSPQGVPLIVVTMREPTRDQEEKDALALFRWAAALK